MIPYGVSAAIWLACFFFSVEALGALAAALLATAATVMWMLAFHGKNFGRR